MACVEADSGLIQVGRQREFPSTSRESGGLKVLDEVAIPVLIPGIYGLHQSPAGEVPVLVTYTTKQLADGLLADNSREQGSHRSVLSHGRPRIPPPRFATRGARKWSGATATARPVEAAMTT